MGMRRVVVRSPVLLASEVDKSTPRPLSPWRMFLGKSVTNDLTCNIYVKLMSKILAVSKEH